VTENSYLQGDDKHPMTLKAAHSKF